MSQVTYVGPSGLGVEIPLPNGGNLHVDPGETVELTAPHAAALLSQGADNWTIAAKAAPASKKKDGE